MPLAVQLNATDAQVLQEYAAQRQIDLADFILQAALKKIEDERDHKLYEEAKAEYEANLVTYSLGEVKERLGL